MRKERGSGTPHTLVTDAPVGAIDEAIALSGTWQVVLFNDEHNNAEYVVICLMKVFGHNMAIAAKIMFEAHSRGRAIAEVEDKEKAQLHKDQLQSLGLTASIEKI